jgi:hypothetical protein
VDHYEIWVNLKDSRRDLEFVEAVNAWLGLLRERGTLESWTIRRRKFGFGPEGLGEFHVSIAVRDLAQLEAAFQAAATREGAVEAVHARVYSMVTDFKSGLYRDFPDAVRVGQVGGGAGSAASGGRG